VYVPAFLVAPRVRSSMMLLLSMASFSSFSTLDQYHTFKVWLLYGVPSCLSESPPLSYSVLSTFAVSDWTGISDWPVRLA
jgi:hypothetical protein